MKKVAFQLYKMRKMNISLNLKIKYVTDLSVSVDSLNVKVYTSY